MPDPLTPGTPVAFVGLGRMGTPLSKRLHGAGYDVRGYDAAPGVRQDFSVDTIAEATVGAQALILMLPDSAAVHAVVTEKDVLGSLPQGALVIDMGSSDPVQTRVLAAEVERHGLSLVDAPVSGGVTGAETGKLTIMVGGDAAAVERCRPLLDQLGRVVVVGTVGAGHALKALNNLLSATHLLASAEALRIGVRFGLDPETMVDAINGSTGRSYSTEYKLPTFVLPKTFDAGFAMQLMNKDVQTALSLAHATHTPAPLAERTAVCWNEAAAHVPADADHTTVVQWLDDLPESH